MNILFLTITKVNSIQERGIYTDLMRKFVSEGHNIYIVCPTERKERKKTSLYCEDKINLLTIHTLNLQKSSKIEKGLAILLVEYQFLSGIKKYFQGVKYDLILYSTPPVTFSRVISFVKERDGAYSYLLLKDIFPQNAVDLGMLKKGSLLHKYFQKKERRLLEFSDTIGCMSDANKSYIVKNYPYLSPDKVEVNPNSIEPLDIYPDVERDVIRKKYNIPVDATVFVFGGNLGLPQGIDFLLLTIKLSKDIKGVFFLIVGSGTEFKKVKGWFENNAPEHALLLSSLDKKEYDRLMSACDVGLIFLNRCFSIPNFPSRLLSYLENKMPVIAATDPNTDIGMIIESYNCGFWVLSGDINGMITALKRSNNKSPEFELMRKNARRLLLDKYTIDKSYHLISSKISHVI